MHVHVCVAVIISELHTLHILLCLLDWNCRSWELHLLDIKLLTQKF